MSIQEFFIRIGDPFIKAILRSPLHGLLSRDILLITYTGRRSGKSFVTPVNYIRTGDLLRVVSFQQRRWWRNLRGGAPVNLWLAGKEVTAWAEVVEGRRNAGGCAHQTGEKFRSGQLGLLLAAVRFITSKSSLVKPSPVNIRARRINRRK